MNLGEMRELLKAEGIRLTQSLGQSFLHDRNQINRIVNLAGLEGGDEVLEIGPGLGPLTEGLLDAGARVLAVEKDARLAALLRKRFKSHSHFRLEVADALRWLREDAPVLGDWIVVSNLPYSVASPILVELAQLASPPRSMTVTLQAEVVDRLRAKPGERDYGLLTVLLSRRYRMGSAFRIPATCFFPAPKVTSACIRMDRRETPLAGEAEAQNYVKIAKVAFSQRRKRLQKVLSGGWPEETVAQTWQALGLDPNIRAERLTPELFAELARRLSR